MAISYFLTGLAIGILPLVKIKPPQASSNQFSWVIKPIYLWGFYGSIVLICLFWALGLFNEQPLDYQFADMLPIIKVMGERWLSGESVYAPIPEIWEGMQPIYLPALWLPYTPLLAVGIDLRVMNVLFLLIPIGLVFLLAKNKQLVPVIFLTLWLPILLLLSYIFINYSTLITISEEPIVVGFYLFFAVAIAKRWPVGQGIFLACCLLSRYALIFWAISYIAYLFLQVSRKQAITIALTSLITGLFLLWISQGIDQLELFVSLKDNYLVTLQDPAQEWGISNITQKNIGLARFVPFSYLPLMHSALFWGSVLLPILLFTFCYFAGRKWISPELFALCSLKLCLVYFFNMNAMPFSYLFYTSTFLSLVVVGKYWSEKACGDVVMWWSSS